MIGHPGIEGHRLHGRGARVSRPRWPPWSKAPLGSRASTTYVACAASTPLSALGLCAEVDAKVKALTSLIEPLMIVFVGGAVGIIVISMYLPIFSLYEKIR